ncbi:MAG: hypothetical protein ACXVEX_05365 [Actinomycetota bacterium]
MRRSNEYGKHTTPTHCSSCGHPISDEKICSCGKPTHNLSFAERSKFEVEQWRAYKAREHATA